MVTIDLASSDVTAIQMQTLSGPVILINMYNDARNSEGVQKVMQYLQHKAQEQSPRRLTHLVWLGDFNTHHPMWDEDHTYSREPTSTKLKK